ncbi:MAG: BatA and WFA domain-containing protein [Candidatus Omnitrophica bacterium]|nr:BatA and WFA domain-containing protein [Candidatus Omnitrophota bacterium]
MGFLQPVFLWGLAGISVPVLIHLFSRKKSPPYFFSTLKFIKLTQKKTIRRQKIEEIIVLLLRTAIVACLFIAIAQPVSKKYFFAEKENWVVLILDDSASMSAGSSNDVWKNLQSASEKILASLKKGTHISVIFSSGKTIPFTTIVEDVAREIRESKPGFHGNTMQLALDKASSMLEKESGYQRIFIVSDLQKQTWEKIESSGLKKINADIIIVDVSENYQSNLTIKDFYPLPVKNTYVCSIINWGNQDVTAELKISDRDYETAKHLTIEKGKTTEIEIKTEKELQSLKAELLYPDILKPDNCFFLQKEASGEKKVLLIGSDDTSIFYTRSSVASAGTISVEMGKQEEIPSMQLEKYRAIIFVNPQRTEPSTRNKIAEYVFNGGTLIYFAGERIVPDDFNSDWYIKEKNAFLMPAKLSNKSDFIRPARIVWVATGHPLFGEFGEKTLDYLKTISFNSCVSIKEITGDILIRLDNGYPALCEKKTGKGRIFLFTFTPASSWTNFQTKPFFPVIMTVMLEYLSGSVSTAYAGSNIVVKGSENADIVTIINPDGKTEIMQNKNKNTVSFTPDTPGIWMAQFNSPSGLQKQITAVNVPWTEGSTEKISYGELRSILKKSHINFISKDSTEKIIEQTTGGQMMIFFLEISLLLLMAELILSNLFVLLREKGIKNVPHKI